MNAPLTSTTSVTLVAIEISATLIAIVCAFCFPKLGSRHFSIVERFFVRLAHRKTLSIVLVGTSAFFMRLALLPILPVPPPTLHDDFSFLLAADTFASGRLTNATPAMWKHFESFHVTMQPTYMSMYFPAQGLVLAAGKVVTGNPWYGLLAVNALMCAAMCWMLQAWLPPRWALLGGSLVVLRISLFSYWINTYTGGGSVAALGGALVLGALPRIVHRMRFLESMLMAAGIILLALSRPYEGLLLCVPVGIYLGRWILFGSNRPSRELLLRFALLPMTLILAAAGWMAHYDYRAFGNAWTPPYAVNRATYAMAPYYVWQPQRPAPYYRHATMRIFYRDAELREYNQIHTWRGFLPWSLAKAARAELFYGGIVLLIPVFMLRRVVLDHRIRFLVLCTIPLILGMAIEIFLIPHYLAPFTAVFYAIGLQAMRHLRVWEPEGRPVGRALQRSAVMICVLLAIARLGATPLHISIPKWPEITPFQWYGLNISGLDRVAVQAELEHTPGKHLAVVRYADNHNYMYDWVYNAADIDQSKVVWAREMPGTQNDELIEYYKDRKVWLVEPDKTPVSITPYRLPAQERASLRQEVIK